MERVQRVIRKEKDGAVKSKRKKQDIEEVWKYYGHSELDSDVNSGVEDAVNMVLSD